MFADRLSTAMKTVGATSSDIARYMGCDRSNVSRFIQGRRVPRQDGGAAQRLSGAICAAAERNGRTHALCGLVCSGYNTAEDIRSRLMTWLYQDEAVTTTEDDDASPISCRSFGQRLDAVMKLSRTSNIRLGQQLSIDPSYISRFRNGLRSPNSNRKIMNNMAAILLDRVFDQGREKELAALMSPQAELPEIREEAYPVFYRWLYGVEKDDSTAIETLIEQISSFVPQTEPPSVSDILKAGFEEKDLYFGENGLREAVIRFMSFVYTNRIPEIYIYCDQGLDWLTEIPEYLAEWIALTSGCVANGTKIQIIHNLESGLEEITRIIQGWLPLYPTGIINSCYCRRKGGERFSAAMFLCPGYACICGHNVKGLESELGMYRYDTDQRLLEAHLNTFRSLLSESGELIRAFPTNQLEKTSMNTGAGITVFTCRLSLATMPEELLSSMLRRGKASPELTRAITEMRKRQTSYYSRCLEKDFIHECIPLFEDEPPLADLPGMTLRYTREEYAAHLRAVAELSEKHAGYRLFPMPQPYFDNIRIRITRDEIIVSRLTSPHITFVFEHPYMCGSFIAYGKKIKEVFHTEKSDSEALLFRTIERMEQE